MLGFFLKEALYLVVVLDSTSIVKEFFLEEFYLEKCYLTLQLQYLEKN